VGNLNTAVIFTGTDGRSERLVFTNTDPLRAQTVRDMACACDEMAVLTESETFSTVGTVLLNIKAQPRVVITAASNPAQAEEALAALGIQVLK